MNVTLKDWRADQRNTRQGYVSLIFSDIGLTIRDVVVHHIVKEDELSRWWFAMPAREYVDREGAKRWWAFILFDEAANKRLQDRLTTELARLVPALFPDDSQPLKRYGGNKERSDHRGPSQAQLRMGERAQAPSQRREDRARRSGTFDDDPGF